jgi:LacI family transcriptional regulator
MLDDLISGRPTPRQVDITSAHVVDRQSTAIVHAEHAAIAAGIGFIRQNYATGITVHDVAEHAGVSRSTLEVGIKSVLGRTPLQEILRLRYAEARHLLSSSEIPMKIIARRCGFTDSKHFSAAFRTATGISPSEYQQQHRNRN